MTEVLSNGTDKPRIFIDDAGDPRPIEDLRDWSEDPGGDPSDIVEGELPYHERANAQYERPNVLEANIERIRRMDIAHQAIRPLTAYEELGGGIREFTDKFTSDERPLDGIIRTMGTKVPEVREAVERFGLNELNLAEYEAMSDTQKKHFIIAFQKFYDHVLGHARRIDIVEGDVSLDPGLVRYGHTLNELPDDVAEYGRYLGALIAAMDGTGIPAHVKQDLQKFYTQKNKLNNILRKTNYQKYQLTFRLYKDGQKRPMRDSHRLTVH